MAATHDHGPSAQYLAARNEAQTRLFKTWPGLTLHQGPDGLYVILNIYPNQNTLPSLDSLPGMLMDIYPACKLTGVTLHLRLSERLPGDTKS